MTGKMLKIAIVGCGKIADAHASVVQHLPGCEIVGVCDSEPLMARQLYERFRVKQWFSGLAELLNQCNPDVVHVTTPPEHHFDIAWSCLAHGCHVYVEKPFTLYADQAEQLVAFAEEKRLKLTVGHNEQFSHVARRMRGLISSGYLGGTPVHMESTYGYDLGDVRYARVLLGDNGHWVRRLPGTLLQNLISHGIARIAELMTTEVPRVEAYAFISPFLRGVGEEDIVDELRVVIAEEERTTAYFTFSSQIRPSIHQFRVYGPKNGLILDQDHEVLICLRGQKFKSYADRFIPPLLIARQQLRNLFGNVRLFLTNDFHMDSGMRYLVEAFYRSISEGGPVPIPYCEILRTARIMDAIFTQLAKSRPDARLAVEAHPTLPPGHSTLARRSRRVF